ncbi:hypothetical protein KNT65_gp159 [Escherichia phage EcS1]|uniref:Uncharacterized protein n=1 Tax=Escherichia phage EcS1 TaxID=2083276 RepID=A0A2Z5ZCW6_9CAUD|nr:hypothetical protein KNT65_gp159 [Escherichia phage EcS1]BBC78334.1 Conserved hypothetical protein [Escherichia phage EcS1]
MVGLDTLIHETNNYYGHPCGALFGNMYRDILWSYFYYAILI